MAQKPLVGQGLLINKASRSYSDTPHSVGPLWMSDQPVAETSTCTTPNIYKRLTSIASVGFETAIPGNERPQTRALDRAASGTGGKMICVRLIGMIAERTGL
jgi:hypothetical protein